MINIFKMVKEFNDKIIKLESSDTLSLERYLWFRGVIKEEVLEFQSARYEMNNQYIPKIKARVDMLDALVDLIYFILGRVQELGFTEDEFYTHFKYVHKANMTKQKGNKGRGSNTDAIKPQGWTGPETKMIKYLCKKEDKKNARS